MARLSPADDERPLDPAVVVAPVLDAEQRRLRSTDVTPVSSPERAPTAPHLPEEVVRGKDHQVASEVAVALDRVELPRRHVLGVPAEDPPGRRAGPGCSPVQHPRDRSRSGSRAACRAGRASGGSRGRTCGTAEARHGAGTRVRAGPCSATPSRTRCRPSRCRSRPGSCTPATCWWGGSLRRVDRPSCAGRRTNGANPMRPSSVDELREVEP